MKNIRILILILLFVIISFTLFTACNSEKNKNLAGRTDGNYYNLPESAPIENEGGKKMVENFKIFGKGIEYYTIVIGKTADSTELNASAELQRYVKEATGYNLPVNTDNEAEKKYEIVVGKTARDTDYIEKKRSGLGSDGYLIAQDHKKLFLTGEKSRGTIYAVYSFLEDYMGWRYYSSTCEKVKESDGINISEDIFDRQIPSFEFRTSFWYNIMSNPDLSVKLKNNFNTLENQGGMFTYAGDLVHTLGTLSEQTLGMNQQPCLTDPEVYATVLKNVRALLAANPDANIISVSQNDSDGEGLGCQCENCKALDDKEGGPIGSLLTFVNRIADDIKEDYPNVYVDTLAYRYTRKPPKNIKPRDNVLIRLCSIECCFAHPLDECSEDKSFTEDLKEWSKIAKNLYIWDYTTCFTHYFGSFPNFSALRQNAKLFHDCNVIGLFEQGNYQSESGEFGELRNYLLSKVMWNVNMSEKEYYAYMDDFLEGYYGAGWKYIREFIDVINNVENTRHVHIYDMPASMIGYSELDSSLHRNTLHTYLSLWDKALEMAADQEEFDRINKSRMQVVYDIMLIEPKETPEFKAMTEKFYEDAHKYKITHMSEGTYVPD